MDYEYNELTVKALNLHYNFLLISSVICLFIEAIYYFVLSYLNLFTDSGVKYIVKFICTPLAINLLLIIINRIIMSRKKLSLIAKAYFLSLSTVAIGLELGIIHTVFPSVYISFDIAVVLTIFYGDRILLTATFIFSFLCRTIVTFISIDKTAVHGRYHFTDAAVSLIILIIIYFISLQIITIEKKKQNIIIQSRKERENLEMCARVDNLTKLMNRKALTDSFKSIYKNKAELPSYFAIFDVDNFKKMNDTYGHIYGDKILKFISQTFLESNDIDFFRYGGDEFCAFIYKSSLENTVSKIRNIQSRAKNCMDISESEIPIEVSVGLTHYTSSSIKPETIFSQADYALYHSKRTNKGSISIFEKIDTSDYNEYITNKFFR